ncbi:MAG TPA: insulinase family protein [Bacteroidales bacterium]|nr:insulinase family protein [Bacteroidales bacterium]HPT09260.1 insulinase family protein [Bacteroidales bacterium]
MKKTNYHGFRLIEKRFVKELNAEVLSFEHEKSGARLIKIAANDPNKTFSITFKTFPESDNGIPHIMEHSVLNGSKNFPVKSPFDVLSKGSLNTFLNAMTSKDLTTYPVASMNEKDYFNLMHVYLDAVFNPLIYTEPRILKQEGWHHELTAEDQPVRYTGVVYNEMKGAFSNPNRELWYQIFKNLFPDNAYGYESGGYPTAIPTLTREEFINFHKKYYHPENSYIFLYGDGDLEKELSFIDSAYLNHYTKNGSRASIEDQKAFPAMKDVTSYYPFMEGSDMKDQTFLSYNFVAGHNTDMALTMALDVLCEVLVNQESAPLRLALQEAGIGQDVSASNSGFKQNAITITAHNANPTDKKKFLEIINNVLKTAADKGLDKKEVEGVINRIEFRLREGDDAQKGITCLYQTLPGWFFADDPFLGLEYEKPLAEVKKALTTDYLEQIIRKYFIGNPHSLLLSLEPRQGLDKERNEKTEAELKTFKASLDKKQLADLVKETNDLIEYQQREDSPKALATIPMLQIADINPEALWYETKQTTRSGVPVLHFEDFANSVVYVNLYFDLRVIPQEMIPYASLLANVLGSLSTKNHTFAELNQALNINTGGFYTSLRTFQENLDDNKLLPKFAVSTKAMNGKLDSLFSLTSEILSQSIYSDTARLKAVLLRHQSQLDATIKGNGYQIASRRMQSYISNQGLFNELSSGIDYYRFVTELMKSYDQQLETVTANLKKVAELLFTRENMIAATTCSGSDKAAFDQSLDQLIVQLPSRTPVLQTWNLQPEKKNEGLMAASKVQYVIEGYNFKKLGYAWNGKMRVLNQILSTDWLQTRIRVIGGAYGGFSSITPNGTFLFSSYRDPNLKNTIENYQATPKYLSDFSADSTTMTRYIIGTIADLDAPQTPSQKGEQAITMYFTKRTKAEFQKDRDAVLSTKAEDIKGFAKLVEDLLSQDALCVYGNPEKIQADKKFFKNLVRL